MVKRTSLISGSKGCLYVPPTLMKSTTFPDVALPGTVFISLMLLDIETNGLAQNFKLFCSETKTHRAEREWSTQCGPTSILGIGQLESKAGKGLVQGCTA